jgi:hypothetical protein
VSERCQLVPSSNVARKSVQFGFQVLAFRYLIRWGIERPLPDPCRLTAREIGGVEIGAIYGNGVDCGCSLIDRTGRFRGWSCVSLTTYPEQRESEVRQENY